MAEHDDAGDFVRWICDQCLDIWAIRLAMRTVPLEIARIEKLAAEKIGKIQAEADRKIQRIRPTLDRLRPMLEEKLALSPDPGS